MANNNNNNKSILNRVKDGRVGKGCRATKGIICKTSLAVKNFGKTAVQRLFGIKQAQDSVIVDVRSTVIFSKPEEESADGASTDEAHIGNYRIHVTGQHLFRSAIVSHRGDGSLHIEITMGEKDDDNYEDVKVSTSDSFREGYQSHNYEFGPKKKIVIEMPSSLPEGALRVIGPESGKLVIEGIAIPATQKQTAVQPTVEVQGNSSEADDEDDDDDEDEPNNGGQDESVGPAGNSNNNQSEESMETEENNKSPEAEEVQPKSDDNDDSASTSEKQDEDSQQ